MSSSRFASTKLLLYDRYFGVKVIVKYKILERILEFAYE